MRTMFLVWLIYWLIIKQKISWCWWTCMYFYISALKRQQLIPSFDFQYSHTLKKLFIDMNKYVRASFHLGPNPPEGLMIRALPIYAVAGFFTAPVRRCPNHAAHGDPSNRDPMWQDKREHLIRVDDDFCMYLILIWFDSLIDSRISYFRYVWRGSGK